MKRQVQGKRKKIEIQMHADGRFVIPKSIRDQLGIGPGSKLDLRVEGRKLIYTPIPEDSKA